MALQMYKSISARYVTAQRFSEALDIFFSGACIELEDGLCYPGEDDLAIAQAVLMYLYMVKVKDANFMMDEIKRQAETKKSRAFRIRPYSIYLISSENRDALPLFNMLRVKFKSCLDREPLLNEELLDEIAERFYGCSVRILCKECLETSSRDIFGLTQERVIEMNTRADLLIGEADNYDGVTITMDEPMDAEVFTERLRASLSHWREEGKKGIWIKLPLGLANLVEAAVSEGFRYHHAEPDYLMLVSWISNAPDTIPANASHIVGVGALVLNKKTGEVLVVQEKSGYFRDKNVWKLPTGVVNEGEDICTGVAREVEEETGIIADFVEVLSFRQSHKSFLKQKTDLFFLCVLSPRSYEITEQKSEILEAKWMPIKEYVEQPWNQNKEMFKYMANICQKKYEEDYMGFSTVETTTGTGKKSFVYCNADHARSLNARRDQASSSL